MKKVCDDLRIIDLYTHTFDDIFRIEFQLLPCINATGQLHYCKEENVVFIHECMSYSTMTHM